MKRIPRPTRRRGALLLGLACAVGALVIVIAGGGGAVAGANQLNLSKAQKRALSGFASFELSQSGALTEAKANAKPTGFQRVSSAPGAGAAPTTAAPSGCPSSFLPNVNVSQNCLNITDSNLQGRAQAQNETSIAQDPNDPSHLLASYNDYRRGDGTCGLDMNDTGSWNDVTTPNGFVRGTAFGSVTREYFEASGDTSVAWDSRGNAYLDCMMFDRGPGVTNNPDLSSGIYVFRSTGNDGRSWNFTGHPVAQAFTNNPAGPLLDKPLMTVDDSSTSSHRDRIYVTWTLFAADGSAKIYEAFSSDYGQTFSAPVLVTDTSPLCTFSFTTANPNSTTCDENQFSQPFTAPDGTLYVVFDNFNTVSPTSTTDNHYQVLLAKSTNGGVSFGSPIKVGDYNDLPDCPTYQDGQDPFRSCVPEKASTAFSVFRATNYPAGGVNPTNSSQIVVTFGSYINQDSNPTNHCTPQGFSTTDGNPLYKGVKKAGACNNKIVVSVSGDGGASFATTDPQSLPVVNQQSGQQFTDQFWQWAAFNGDGKLAVSYFDRQYGTDETTGQSDISLSDSSGDMSTWTTTRVTSGSMPVPTQFPDAQGNSVFYGDYTGLSAAGGNAHPLWMDTRNPDLFLCPGTGAPGVPPATCTATEPDGLPANDERIYTDTVALP